MLTKQRYEIKPLPIIPEDASFMIRDRYAKVENDILFLWDKIEIEWESCEKSLSEYNDYEVLESHEYNPSQIMYAELKNLKFYCGGFKISPLEWENTNEYWIYKDWDEEYKISIYEPKPKGFKGVNGRTRYSGGEYCLIRKNLYPQLDDIVGDNIMKCKPQVFRD